MHQPLPPLTQIPADIVALNDYTAYAKARMSAQAWAYFSGGVEDEALLARNEQGPNRKIWPRVLTDMSQAQTALSLFGYRYDYPIFLAPIAYQKMAHPDGELASALGAAAMRTPFIISMQASERLERIAEHAPGPQWLQWYWQPDQKNSQALLQKAVDQGIQAIVLTVDAPVNGLRNTEQRAQFRLPEGIEAVNLAGFQRSALSLAPAGQSPLFSTGFLATTPHWSDIEAFIQACPLPVLLKGILHPDDAHLALEVGAAGIVVSNHGGRLLDDAPTSWQVLPAVAQAVDGAIPILLDGGVRRGADVFQALALGATAVLIGRPYVYALAAAGASGVAHVLHILRTELEVTMTLAGCATLDAIQPPCLV